ncbi:hypothetical protein PG996_003098 [Apiospora saccharicola]|uniref:Zn(2)-C6 fungal-type domain-containing protein n=1 Tax=Apiospora saccharicola TaxID=335842 RepID=A0ABR1W0D6_9PEZI
MFSHSLANRTKAPEVPQALEASEGTLSGSCHEPSLEELYLSQESLAFYTPSDVDAFEYALSPEPIREEKEEPTAQVTGTMVVRKSCSSSSAGDVATPAPPQAKKKKKYTRAFSHRARTGCMTWPTCRRCAAAKVVCDGYPLDQPPSSKEAGGSAHSQAVAKSTASTSGSSPTSSSRGSPSRRSSAPLFTINPIVFESATEARYFHHFRVCTRFGLAESAGLLDFWDAYALPIAHQEDYLRQTISAVGAAHQLFVIRSYTASSSSSSSSWDTDQENAAIQQYNRAISSLVKAMSSPNSVASTHGALLCCLMFVTFESLLGRYSESIKHIQSGFQLLASLDAGANIRDPGLWQQTYDMFARLGLEFSAFMDAPLTPALPSNIPVAPWSPEPSCRSRT